MHKKIVGIIFQVWLGPNAVLAFKREGYSWFDVSCKDLLDVLKYPGFYKLASKYLRYGSSEMIRSIMISLSGKVIGGGGHFTFEKCTSCNSFNFSFNLLHSYSVKELQKFVPSVTAADISRGPAGVRAQAMNASGDLIGDFIFDSGPDSKDDSDSNNIIQKRVIHCRNAPSPGATSSLAIGRMMADMMEDRLGLPKTGNAKLY